MKNIIEWLKGIVGDNIIKIVLAKLLTKENILKALDYVLDLAEELALKTEKDWDDKALKAIREALNVPEFDNK